MGLSAVTNDAVVSFIDLYEHHEVMAGLGFSSDSISLSIYDVEAFKIIREAKLKARVRLAGKKRGK